MNDMIDSEGFRANVGIVLMRGTGQVFVGRRAAGRGWQFPQGGMRHGEEPEQTLFRELQEEVGLTRADVTLVGGTAGWLNYRLPRRYIRHHQLPLCIGQKQRWFLLRVKSDDIEFDLAGTDTPEFDRWRWVDYWSPVREVIYFKRPVYASALEELASLAFPAGQPARPAWWAEAGATARRKS
jgi:putative (di)nucleoside polyphosphate hydrolase